MNLPAAASSPTDRPRRFGWRVGFLAVVVLVAGSVAPTPAAAQTDEDAALQAALEIREAREQANAAADAYFQAESDLDVLKEDLIRLERAGVDLQATVDRLRKNVESVAVARFVNSGSTGMPLLTGLQKPQDQVQADVFVDVLTNTGSDALDAYDIAEKQLRANEVELDQRKHDIEQQQIVFVQLQQTAEDEVVRLRAVEEVRLKDVAVQRALEAQLAAERVKLEDQARREAEAAANAIPDPGEGITIPTTTVPSADGADGEIDPNDVGADGDSPADGTTEDTTPPSTAAPSNSGASGGASGGRTGTGGTGSNPRPVDTGAGYLDSIICPMPGSGFGDTWGAPRSGGRKHEGVDMIAPRGIPIYAVTSGFATFKSNALGGNAVSLVGDNGNRYYYGHLDAYEGSSRTVVQGEIVGYNGDTGNARFSTPHLHFEIHPGGGLAVNPYPTVVAIGC